MSGKVKPITAKAKIQNKPTQKPSLRTDLRTGAGAWKGNKH